MTVWIGVDVGGTFTDVVAFDDAAGHRLTHKLPSTPHNSAERFSQDCVRCKRAAARARAT